jgi:hypothetical protein
MSAGTSDMAKRQGIGAKKETYTEQEGNGAQQMFAGFNQAFVKMFDQNRSMVQHLMQAMQEESMRFMNTRIEHTSQALERSRECQGLAGFFTVQQDWLADMAHDYAEFNKRCGELFQETAEHGVEQAQERTAESARQAKSPSGERAAA